jgi:hypothetical protein
VTLSLTVEPHPLPAGLPGVEDLLVVGVSDLAEEVYKGVSLSGVPLAIVALEGSHDRLEDDVYGGVTELTIVGFVVDVGVVLTGHQLHVFPETELLHHF